MISIKVSANGLPDVVAEIEKKFSKQAIEEKADELCKRLADIGEQEADYLFNVHGYKTDPVTTSVEKIENGYKIVATGKDVCFIEFGAGVYYNGKEPYPNPPGRPAGIVGIGEYGMGQGKQNGWWYYDKSHNLQYSHGTPAAMPMYNATKEMLNSVTQIANEVFND